MTEPTPYASAPQPTPYAAPVGAPRPTNTLAIIALIAAFIIPLAGIITGHIALGQIKRTGEGGHGLALWGTILGYVFSAFYVIGIIIYVVVIAAAVTYGTTNGY